jgi:O-antigen ligase
MMKKWERWLLPFGLVSLAWMHLPGAWMEYHQGKWVGFYWLALAALTFFLLSRPVFPEMKRWEGFSLLAIAAGMLAHLFWFHPSGYEFSLLDRAGFFVILLSSWRGFASGAVRWKDFWWPLAVMLLVVCGYGVYQLIRVGFPGAMPYNELGSTFGYANNAAQAVGLSLLVWWGIPRRQSPLAAAVLYGVSALSLTYLVFSRGRSALLAFGLGALVFGFLKLRQAGGGSLRKVGVGAAVVAVVLSLFGGVQIARGKSVAEVLSLSIFREKSPMMAYRLDVWQQTVRMIQEHPLGVGVDRFTFQFVPYHRQGSTISFHSATDSPHNEFLRYLAEDGIPLSLLFALVLAIFLLRWWKSGALHRELLLPAFAFLLGEMLVQFPWQNTFPTYFGAVIFGSMAAGIWERKAFPRHAWAKAVSVLLVFLFAFTAGKATVSRLTEKSQDEFWAKASCRTVSSNWRACLNYSRVLLRKGESGGARKELERMLEKDPWNYAAIRHLGVVAQRQGDRLEACFLTWKYDDIFLGKSDLNAAYVQNCPARWRSYFDRKRPKKYYRR